MSSLPFILPALVLIAPANAPTSSNAAVPIVSAPAIANADTAWALASADAISPASPIALVRPTMVAESMDTKRHNRAGRLGALTWSIEVERRHSWSAVHSSSNRRAQHRFVGLDAELGRAVGNDLVVAYLGGEFDKRPDRVASGEQAFASTRTMLAGIGWSHRGAWRIDIGLHKTNSRAKSASARLIDLASGAPRAERQATAQFTLAPMAMKSGMLATFGAQASAGRLTGFDPNLARIGTAPDRAALLFARVRF